jgi:hypothetical protein
MISQATIAPTENPVATASRSGPRESASSQMSEVTTAKAPAARAAAREPDRPVISRHGRLARTIPASSRTWPRTPGRTKRTSTLPSEGTTRRIGGVPREAGRWPGRPPSSDAAASSATRPMTMSRKRWYSRRAPEGRQRGQGDTVGQVGLGQDRPQAAAAGQIGQADHQIPAFPRPALVGDGQDLLLVGEVEALAPDPDLPGHLIVEVLCQQFGQLGGQLLGQLGGEVRVGQQAEHQAAGAPGPLAIGCRHGHPSPLPHLVCGTAWPAHRPERHPQRCGQPARMPAQPHRIG